MDHPIGVVFAPGQMTDLAMNQNVDLALRRTHPDRRILMAHPEPRRASIEQQVSRLIAKQCSEIFLLGSQCKAPAVSAAVRAQLDVDLDLVFVDDARNLGLDGKGLPTASQQHPWPRTLLTSGTSITGKALRISAENFHEYQLGRALGLATTSLCTRRSLSHAVFVGGADIPVVREWSRGLNAGLASASVKLVAEFVGNTYSRFDDPWAAYRLTRRLIEQYDARVVIQACGASCTGVLAAALESGRAGRDPVSVACLDYAEWEHPYNKIVFASLTRDIHRRILGDRTAKPGTLHLYDDELLEHCQEQLSDDFFVSVSLPRS